MVNVLIYNLDVKKIYFDGLSDMKSGAASKRTDILETVVEQDLDWKSRRIHDGNRMIGPPGFPSTTKICLKS